MTLRTRLALAFVFVVLVPVIASAIVVATVLPGRLDSQVRARVFETQTAAVTGVMQACATLDLEANVLGRMLTGSNANQAVNEIVRQRIARWAGVVGPRGGYLATASSAPGITPPPTNSVDCSQSKTATDSLLVGAIALRGDPRFSRVVIAEPVSDVLRDTSLVVLNGREVVNHPQLSDSAVRRIVQAVQGKQGVQAVGPWRVSVAPAGAAHPFTVIAASTLPNLRTLEFVLVIATVGAIVIAYVIGRQLSLLSTRPLTELSAAADRIAAGDLGVSVPVRSRDEVSQLARAFNVMSDSLRELFGALQQSRDEVRRSVARLGEALGHTHDLAGILGVVLDSCLGVVHARAGGVFIVDARGDLRAVVASGLPDGVSIPSGVGVAGRAVAEARPVRWPSAAEPDLAPSAGEPATAGAIAVPIVGGGRVYGLIALYDARGGGAFSEDDLQIVRTLAAQAANAVDNVLLHEEAQRLSITDGLTGLWNRRYFAMNVGKEIDRAARFGRNLSVLMLDLDRFKAINDTYGHQRGDAVLVELAGRVKSQIRDVDLLARYGGEELVLVLPEADEQGAARTAERICTAVRSKPFGADEDEPLTVTVSIGAATFPGNGSTPDDLVRAADAALYAAKRNGRDRWQLAGPIDVTEPTVEHRSRSTPG